MSTRVSAYELSGEIFGRWSVIERATKLGKHGEVYWCCRCLCGTIRDVKGASLMTEQSLSCGCFNRQRITKHGMEGSPVYDAWAHMIQRCENPKNKGFADYGGRGIRVCAEWRDSFEAFYRDMGDRPSPKHSIGREDNDGNYEPTNCRWETPTQQMRNRRTTYWIEFEGERRHIGEWAEIKGWPSKVIRDRLIAGWSASDALTRPYPSNRWARRDVA